MATNRPRLGYERKRSQLKAKVTGEILVRTPVELACPK